MTLSPEDPFASEPPETATYFHAKDKKGTTIRVFRSLPPRQKNLTEFSTGPAPMHPPLPKSPTEES